MRQIIITMITTLVLLGCNLPREGTGITLPSQATVAVNATIELVVSISGYLDPNNTVTILSDADRATISARYDENSGKLFITGLKTGTASLVLKNNIYTSNRLIVTVT